ncbi:hypothetical protein, partial [Klebsiella pneumoniae]|uniref:hypothetical protein n=1 Tax=Klebsiella pneumoniae TaxID=573 RepID=UPI00210CC194
MPKPHRKGDGYIECGNGQVVTWCIGHLLEQAQRLTRLFRATEPSETVNHSPAKAQRAASREKAFMPIF